MSASPDEWSIELRPPDLEPWHGGNGGTPGVWRFEATAPGPAVLVTALVHGNEYCGALVLAELLASGLKPRRGSLSLMFCNLDAFARFEPKRPFASRYVDEDLNRVWGPGVLEGTRVSSELTRARALRPHLAGIDLLLDLHSMQNRAPALALAGTTVRGLELARRLGFPRDVVIDAGHAAGVRLRDWGPFGAPDGQAAALLVECGQHWEGPSLAVARETTRRFLVSAGTIDPGDLPWAPMPSEPQRIVEVMEAVTIETEQFEFLGPWQGMETIAEAGVPIARDGARTIRTPFPACVLVMPSRRLRPGQTAVRLGRIRPPGVTQGTGVVLPLS